MIRLFVCLLLMLSLTPARAHPPPIVTTDQEKAFADEIIAWRKAFAEVARSGDARKLRDLYAPSFVHSDSPGGQSSRDQRVSIVLSGAPVIELAPVEDLVIRVPGGWTAIATGRSTVKLPATDKATVVTWMAVYVRAGDGWQLAASQATPWHGPRP